MPAPLPPTKRCPGCQRELSPTAFGRNASRPDGLAYYCKDCFSAVHRRSYRKRRAERGESVREPRVAPPGTRWCPDCEEHVPLSRFGRNASAPTGVTGYCLEHQQIRSVQSRVRRSGSVRDYHLLRRYGVTAEDVEVMRERQEGRCAICARELGERPHVDHDHESGRVRGLLCFTCNVGLGNFSDDVDRLRRAIAYLGHHPGTQACWYELSADDWHQPAAV